MLSPSRDLPLPFLKFAHLDLGSFVTSQLVVSERIKQTLGYYSSVEIPV